MGNCIQHQQRSSGSRGAFAGRRPAERSGRRRSTGGDGDEDHGAPSSVVKVKVVLTKGELGWLVARLKEAGDRRLEDVLHEVARKREDRASAGGGGDGWRPGLESIVECPTEETEAAAGASSDD